VQGDTGEVRTGEALDWDALAAYLRWHFTDDQLPGLRVSAPMEVLQFHGGHSNLTYVVRFGGAELVVRRPPFGPVPPRAHDMAREFRWLAALHPVFPLAPRPYLLCEDTAVLGSVFYVMERRRGMAVRREEPLPLAGHPDARRRLSEAMVDTLAALHAVPVTREPFTDLGRPSGFVARQVQGWTDRWQRARLDDLPEMDAVAAWLAEHMPADPDEPAIVHGDFKLDNVLLDPLEPGRVTAVLDWEMCAVGDPLVDLGIMLAYWTAPVTGGGEPDALTTVTGRPGYLSRDEIVDAYAWRSGRDVDRLAFYETFALFKIAVVIQQIALRYRQGQTADPRFATFGDRVTHLARQAAALVA
jgi:aminoglycoside phosphotransferase (APT) family kinase protein